MPQAVFSLQNASISGPEQTLLEGLSFDLREGAVTALMGPAGTGKSTLLRHLAGAAPRPGFSASGTWAYRGDPLGPQRDLAWVPQRPSSDPAESALQTPSLDDALASQARTLLLDEPTRLAGVSADDLAPRLRSFVARGGSVVVVTHDVSFARAVADDVVFLCAKRVIAAGDTRTIFDNPPSDLVARFLTQGNCWPAPQLPAHFRWIIEGKLAGMGRPGLLGPIDDDLAGIASNGVTMLVTLTEEPLPLAALKPHGISPRHFPILDMGVPAVGPCASLCREIERAIASGECVAVHCHAGLGRTGTILAAYLVWTGEAPDAAITRLREIRPQYIQTRSQQDFVKRFASSV